MTSLKHPNDGACDLTG